MIIADTSIWVEFLKGNASYFEVFALLVEEKKIYVLGCIFGELLQGSKNEKEIKILQEYWQTLPKINEQYLWIQAGILSAKEKLYSKGVGLIDAVILQAARNYKYKIWTLDKKLIKCLDKTEYFEQST